MRNRETAIDRHLALNHFGRGIPVVEDTPDRGNFIQIRRNPSASVLSRKKGTPRSVRMSMTGLGCASSLFVKIRIIVP